MNEKQDRIGDWKTKLIGNVCYLALLFCFVQWNYDKFYLAIKWLEKIIPPRYAAHLSSVWLSIVGFFLSFQKQNMLKFKNWAMMAIFVALSWTPHSSSQRHTWCPAPLSSQLGETQGHGIPRLLWLLLKFFWLYKNKTMKYKSYLPIMRKYSPFGVSLGS